MIELKYNLLSISSIKIAILISIFGWVQTDFNNWKSTMLIYISFYSIYSYFTIGIIKISIGIVEYFLINIRKLATKNSLTSF